VDYFPVEPTFYGYERKDYHAYLLEPPWGGIDLRWCRVDLTGHQYFARQLHDWTDPVGSVWGDCLCDWFGDNVSGESPQAAREVKKIHFLSAIHIPPPRDLVECFSCTIFTRGMAIPILVRYYSEVISPLSGC
jgi:hypothetical protein